MKTISVRFLKHTLMGYQKYNVCLLKQNNPEILNCNLAKIYNISESTISRILKKSDHWLNIDPNSIETQSRRIKGPKFPLLEKALMVWVNNALQANLIITGFILTYQAQEFARLLHINDFIASEGWLTNFKKHTNLRQFVHHGEANSAPLKLLPKFREELQDILKDWALEDIFNCDETALYWKMEPFKSLVKKAIAGKKKDKQRVTILLYSNFTGIKIFIIYIIFFIVNIIY